MPLRTEANDFRPAPRRHPPDYTQRSVKLRLFIYLAVIMAVLSVIERSRDPEMWQWMWGRQAEVAQDPFDNRLRESGHRTEHDPAGTFVAVPDSKSDAQVNNAHDDAANADQESPEIVLARAAIQDDTPVF